METAVRAVRAVLAGVWLLVAWASSAAAADGRPMRIVSLNLCTDQILMMLVDPGRIAAVSYLSRNPDASVMAAEAAGLPVTHGLAEEILTLKPDLVIAGTFTTRPTVQLLQRLGYRVLVVPPAYGIDDIRRNVRRIAGAVHEPRRGDALIADFDRQLAALAAPAPERGLVAATYYASNYTSGSATLADDLIRAAGFRNLAAEMGKRGTARLALEHLIWRAPDLVVLGRTRAAYRTVTAENLKHPALNAMLRRVPAVVVPDKLWICGTPHSLDVVARLAVQRRRILAARSPQ